MSERRRLVACLSGGVDSAVAAARAVDQGHDVVGVHLAMSRVPAAGRSGSRGCCSRDDARDAARVADTLGIPYYVWDVSAEFQREVVDDFVAGYAGGRTPNPCLRCNEHVKFEVVLERALALGFDGVCTGHYARVAPGPRGPQLLRALDQGKDQSYVLSVLSQAQLAGAVFPLGGTRKALVRAEAAVRGLRVAAKPDSHDICFIPDGDTAGFLRHALGGRPGDIVDARSGRPLGRHEGAYAFTVGQRRGLGLGRPAEDGRPRFVVSVDVPAGRVLVGSEELLSVRSLEGIGIRWCGPVPDLPMACTAQVRAHGRPVPATASRTGDRLTVLLDRPLRGVAPGQAVALYDGPRVLGSATIERTGAA